MPEPGLYYPRSMMYGKMKAKTCEGGRELTKEQFIALLIKAGWPEREAKQEWEDIQNDEEGEP